MEKNFRVHKIFSKEARLNKVIQCLEGAALQWYIWNEDPYAFENWDDFQVQIGQRFGVELSDNILHQFFDIKRTGTMKEYRTEYERLSVSASVT